MRLSQVAVHENHVHMDGHLSVKDHDPCVHAGLLSNMFARTDAIKWHMLSCVYHDDVADVQGITSTCCAHHHE
jgi:hypothetical protein